MSKKYVIEINPEYEDTTKGVMVLGARESNLYVDTLSIEGLEELNSDYINEHYGELQDEAYQRGLEDAWEAARKIVVSTDYGGIASETLLEIFGMRGYSYIMQDNTAQEAIDKIKAYEDKQKDRIEVGDEVATGTGKKYTVVSFGDGGTVCGFNTEGKWTGWKPKEVTKTGRHFDIEAILEAMRK